MQIMRYRVSVYRKIYHKSFKIIDIWKKNSFIFNEKKMKILKNIIIFVI
jgi:hypothetical protein